MSFCNLLGQRRLLPRNAAADAVFAESLFIVESVLQMLFGFFCDLQVTHRSVLPQCSGRPLFTTEYFRYNLNKRSNQLDPFLHPGDLLAVASSLCLMACLSVAASLVDGNVGEVIPVRERI